MGLFFVIYGNKKKFILEKSELNPFILRPQCLQSVYILGKFVMFKYV